MIIFERKGEDTKFHTDVKLEVGLNWEASIDDIMEYFAAFLKTLSFTEDQITAAFAFWGEEESSPPEEREIEDA